MFKVSIVRKDALCLFDGMANAVTLPGEDGELTILPFHCPMVVRLRKGTIRIEERELPIYDGIVRMENNEMHAIVE